MPIPERVAFSIFGLDIMWYGILVALGIAVAVVVGCYRAPKHGLTPDKSINFLIVIIVCGIIGARLYYVIFNWPYYSADLIRIFQFREGGLAIHGGLLAGALALLILCRFWKESPLNMLDLYFVAVPIGQAIGRWGNYFNSEAHGGPTNLPWAVTVDGVKMQPTFLYESIWCFLLFFFLLYMDNRRKFQGQTLLLYCMLYSVERFFVEWLRTDSLMLFGIFRMAQVISAAAIILGAVFYVILSRRAKARLTGAASAIADAPGDAGPPADEKAESKPAAQDGIEPDEGAKADGALRTGKPESPQADSIVAAQKGGGASTDTKPAKEDDKP